jgi:hypothetical protein
MEEIVAEKSLLVKSNFSQEYLSFFKKYGIPLEVQSIDQKLFKKYYCSIKKALYEDYEENLSYFTFTFLKELFLMIHEDEVLEKRLCLLTIWQGCREYSLCKEEIKKEKIKALLADFICLHYKVIKEFVTEEDVSWNEHDTFILKKNPVEWMLAFRPLALFYHYGWQKSDFSKDTLLHNSMLKNIDPSDVCEALMYVLPLSVVPDATSYFLLGLSIDYNDDEFLQKIYRRIFFRGIIDQEQEVYVDSSSEEALMIENYKGIDKGEKNFFVFDQVRKVFQQLFSKNKFQKEVFRKNLAIKIGVWCLHQKVAGAMRKRQKELEAIEKLFFLWNNEESKDSSLAKKIISFFKEKQEKIEEEDSCSDSDENLFADPKKVLHLTTLSKNIMKFCLANIIKKIVNILIILLSLKIILSLTPMLFYPKKNMILIDFMIARQNAWKQNTLVILTLPILFLNMKKNVIN